MKQVKKNIANLFIENITETEQGLLLGGFSNVSTLMEDIFNPQLNETNNCNGGNCVAGCGSGQTINSCDSTKPKKS